MEANYSTLKDAETAQKILAETEDRLGPRKTLEMIKACACGNNWDTAAEFGLSKHQIGALQAQFGVVILYIFNKVAYGLIAKRARKQAVILPFKRAG